MDRSVKSVHFVDEENSVRQKYRGGGHSRGDDQLQGELGAVSSRPVQGDPVDSEIQNELAQLHHREAGVQGEGHQGGCLDAEGAQGPGSHFVNRRGDELHDGRRQGNELKQGEQGQTEEDGSWKIDLGQPAGLGGGEVGEHRRGHQQIGGEHPLVHGSHG